MPASNVLAFPTAPVVRRIIEQSRSESRTFHDVGRFKAVEAAERLLKARGFSIGTMQGVMPRGLRYGHCHISKWGGMLPGERVMLHGKMTGDMINGPVTVEIFGSAPADARAAIAREV